jgi:DNA polymerase-1
VPLDSRFDAIPAAVPDPKRLVHFFQSMGFQSLVKKVAEGSREAESRDYRLVRTEEELRAMLGELRRAGEFAVDTETTSLFPMDAEIVGVSFSAASMRAYYVPFNAVPPVLEGGPKAILAALEPLLTDPALRRTGQNTKYDWLVFAANGLRLPPPDFDTMIASYCVAGTSRRHGIDELALVYFDLKKIPTSELIGTGKNEITMDRVPVEKVAEYACEDADVAWRLKGLLAAELAVTGSETLFRELEMPLVPVLAAMEERGIRLDVRVVEEIRAECDRDAAAAVAEIHRLAGFEFNVNSTKALGEVLFEKLRIQEAAGVKRVRRTQTGFATDHATLEEHYGDVPIVRRLLEHRELQKLVGTYLEPLPAYVSARTGRVHCSFSQVSAATGRLASSDPNLQNIPVRTERGRELRRAFVPKERDARGEWVLLSADYSQVELRVLAHLCGDPALVRAFAEDKDIHTETAATVFGIMPELVTREMRSRAKAINFGLLYGMGPARLARDTGLSVPEARQFIERYFASFPRVRGWIDATLEKARTEGFVETLLGRKRRFPELASGDSRMRSFAENAAVNTPVQGSAADVIKRAMIVLEERLELSPLAGRMLLQVHDELLLEVPEKELDETRELVRDCMMNAVPLRVPLKGRLRTREELVRGSLTGIRYQVNSCGSLRSARHGPPWLLHCDPGLHQRPEYGTRSILAACFALGWQGHGSLRVLDRDRGMGHSTGVLGVGFVGPEALGVSTAQVRCGADAAIDARRRSPPASRRTSPAAIRRATAGGDRRRRPASGPRVPAPAPRGPLDRRKTSPRRAIRSRCRRRASPSTSSTRGPEAAPRGPGRPVDRRALRATCDARRGARPCPWPVRRRGRSRSVRRNPFRAPPALPPRPTIGKATVGRALGRTSARSRTDTPARREEARLEPDSDRCTARGPCGRSVT